MNMFPPNGPPMNYIILHDAALEYYVIDLIIVLAILAGLRFFSGVVANTSLHEVLSVQDNAAVGISLTGAVIGVAIMLMGAVAGDAGGSLAQEALLMLGYGIVGIGLMWVTSRVFDNLSMPGISVRDLIERGNTAAALTDAGNLIATAIIVRAVMSWVDGSTYTGLAVVLAGYVIAQVILYLATRYRIFVFAKRHTGNSLEHEIATENIALAVRFAGHRIGVGLAVTATSGIVVYSGEDILYSLSVWSALAIGMFLAQTVICIAARLVLLPGINVGEEVGEQRNIAIGSLEGAIYVAIGLVFAGLFG
uniref:DUF350 domain-containing protein n=1 Tax=Candidatus Kentrum sp. FM TaxID=2126340 RepID=A0A450SCL0_9GAMM|nr:MAG: protein of unknown function (DUF350) [Candidatus Kentron sp. FM]VFJ50092.1 MAG: protein of unknown function (DUF350) [Candidatus Kentron sp. FM]VFK08653.1 MAG: protein of unknown function (DUF350) [Candidatus Kentron sp. FM]